MLRLYFLWCYVIGEYCLFIPDFYALVICIAALAPTLIVYRRLRWPQKVTPTQMKPI